MRRLAAALALAVPALAGAVEPAPGRLLWRTPMPAGIEPPSGVPAVDGGRFYVLSAGIAAFDVETGRLLWRGGLERFVPRALVAGGGRVFAAEGVVLALDGATGAELWRFEPAANASLGVPALDGDLLFAGTAGGELLALDAATGARRWSATVAGAAAGAAVVRGVAVEGGAVYVAVEEGPAAGKAERVAVVALDRAGGARRWRWQAGGSGERRSAAGAPVVADGLVLVADALGNALFALDAASGAVVWRWRGERGRLGPSGPPAVAGPRVLFAGGFGAAVALDLATGRVLWRTPLPAAAAGFAACGGELAVGFGALVFLEVASGRLAAGPLGSPLETLGGVLGAADGRLLAAGSRAVYAFACPGYAGG
jgi:outer membrane protein assembly factor BamB